LEAATLADDFLCASHYCTIDECCRVLPLCSDDELDDGDRCQDKDSVQCEKKRIVNEKCTFPGFTIRRRYRSDCSDGLNSCLKVDGQPNKKIYDLEEAMTKCKENPECGKIMQEEDGTYNLRYAKDPVKGPSWKSGLTILFEKIEVEIGDYGDYADYGDYGDHGDYSDDNSSDASLDVNCGLGRAPTCSDCSKLWCYADCELVKNECRLKDAKVVVKIIGSPVKGGTLKADTSAIPKPVEETQWIDVGNNEILSRTDTYLLTRNDIGKQIKLRVTFTRGGEMQFRDSVPTASIKGLRLSMSELVRNFNNCSKTVQQQKETLKGDLTEANSDERSKILGRIKKEAQDCQGIIRELNLEVDMLDPTDPDKDDTKKMVDDLSNVSGKLFDAVLKLPDDPADILSLSSSKPSNSVSFLTPLETLESLSSPDYRK
jgi:hypothetical protein